MAIAIASVGLATAQGSRVDLLQKSASQAPRKWPWPTNGWSTAQLCRPASEIGPELRGINRWRLLVKAALKDCFGNEQPLPGTPIFVGSCNGIADDFDEASWCEAFDSVALLDDTVWAGQSVPVFSSSCNSGMHALYAATKFLEAAEGDEAVVLAADILSQSNQNNFDVLRVLHDTPMPWQSTSLGFMLGDAAVVLRLVRVDKTKPTTILAGPVLANELRRNDGLPRVLNQIRGSFPNLLMGQGTGPIESDQAELEALRDFVSEEVPLTTALLQFGHTLGASGLLSIALAVLIHQTRQALPNLVMPAQRAIDGRPLLTESRNNPDSIDNVMVSCRALNGSCAAAVVGNPHQVSPVRQITWHSLVVPGPLMHKTLQEVAAKALGHRPAEPPDVLVVKLQEPLAPPPEAGFGGRLLPSAVLEMTPGFVSQLIAGCWGFVGPTLCVVGNENEDSWNLNRVHQKLNLVVAEVNLSGRGDKREVEWHA